MEDHLAVAAPNLDRDLVIEELGKLRWAALDFAVYVAVRDPDQQRAIYDARDEALARLTIDSPAEIHEHIALLETLQMPCADTAHYLLALTCQIEISGSLPPWQLGTKFAVTLVDPT